MSLAGGQPHLEIALLHRVEEPAGGALGPYVEAADSPRALERYLTDRASWARVQPDELHADGGPVNDGCCFLLTFDDGYRSFRERALPLLEKHDVPGLLFIATGFVGGEEPPYELTLADLIGSHDELRLPGGETLRLLSAEEKHEAYRRVRLPLKPRAPRERRAFMKRFLDANGLAPPAPRGDEFLGWDELCELDGHPLVHVGAHSHSHPLLTGLPWREAWGEIRRSKRELERRLGHGVDSFAYPYGGFGRAVRQLVRLAGFRCAFTTQALPVPRGAAFDRFAIPRYDLAALAGEPEPSHV